MQLQRREPPAARPLAALFGMVAAMTAMAHQGRTQTPVLLDTEEATMPRSMAPTQGLWPCDLDGDGWPDLLVGTDCDSGAFGYPASSSQVLLNRGDGRLICVSAPQPMVQRSWQAVGDFDGDGDLDVFYLRTPVDGMGVAENVGGGAFVYHDQLLGYLSPRSWAAADYDGDGDVDLCSGMELFFNAGGFSFVAAASGMLPTVSASPPRLAAADLDGDGDVDLVVGDDAGPMRLWLNDGSGRFVDVSATNLPAGGSPVTALGMLDFDGDADLDVIAGHGGDRPTLYLNGGGAVFTALRVQRFYDVLSLAVGDFDGDALPDVALGLTQGGVILRNTGGTLHAPFTPGWVPGPAPVTALAAVDLDRDGDLDLAVGGDRLPHGSQPNGLEDRVFWGDGLGGFRGPGDGALPTNVTEATLGSGDFDGDGDADLLDTGGGGCLWRNDGWGVFVAAPLGLPVTGRPVVGDLDGDGDLDAVVLDVSGGFHVLVNPGDGRLWPRQSHWLPPLPSSGRVEAGVLGDFDGDADLDLFVATWADEPPYGLGAADALWLNDGAGWFSDASSLLPPGATHVTDAASGDLDRDGDLDLVTTGGSVYENRPGGFVAQRFYIDNNYGESHIALADLDGDGWLDLVAGNACRGLGCAPSNAGGWDVVHWNDGAGALGTSQILEYQSSMATSVAVADFDEDGDLDFVIGHRGVVGSGHDNPAENVLYLNEGGRVLRRAGGAFARAEFPLEYDETVALSAVDVDADGDVDLVVGNGAVDPGRSPRSKVHRGAMRQLVMPDLARLGQPLTVRVHGAEFGAAVFAATVPAHVPLPPYGVVGLSLDDAVSLAWLAPRPAGQAAEFDLSVPNTPALSGLVVYFQAAVGGASLQDMRLTNRTQETVRAH